MAKQDFAVRIPILCVFQLLVKVFLPQDKIGKLLKIGSPAARFGLAIQFILKFCFRNHLYNVSILMGLRVKILVVDETTSQIDHTVLGGGTVPFFLSALEKQSAGFCST